MRVSSTKRTRHRPRVDLVVAVVVIIIVFADALVTSS